MGDVVEIDQTPWIYAVDSTGDVYFFRGTHWEMDGIVVTVFRDKAALGTFYAPPYVGYMQETLGPEYEMEDDEPETND